MIRKYCKDNFAELIFVISFVTFYMLRVIALDADLPSYGKTGFQQVDEGSYSYLALNKINYGVINPDNIIEEVEQYTAPHLRTNFLGNLFTFAGLKILGDNYYGLRVGSVLCMFLNFVALYCLLGIIDKRYMIGKAYIKWGVMFFMLFDFMLTVASRVVEPSVYRMFALEIILIMYFIMDDNRLVKPFLLGLVSVFSVFGIYITNLFIVLACITTLIFATYKKGIKKLIVSLGLYGVGGCISLLACNLYYSIFWETNIIRNTWQAIRNFSVYEEYQSVSSVKKLIKIVLNFCGNNFNIYDMGLWMVFLFCIPIVIMVLIKKKDDKLFFCFALYSIFFFQTLYSEDFIQRKYFIIIPVEICIIYIVFGIVKQYGKEMLCSTRVKNFMLVYYNICALFSILILIYRMTWISDGSILDFSKFDRVLILGWGIVCILVMLNIGILWILNLTGNLFAKKLYFYIICGAGLILVNIYMNARYVYTNHTYGDRNTMIAINDMEMESKYIIGSYFLGFSLYNDKIPVVNYYEEMKNMLVEEPALYYFDYSTNFVSEDYIKGILTDTKYELVMYKEFKRDTQTLGTVRNVALYEVKKVKNKQGEKSNRKK